MAEAPRAGRRAGVLALLLAPLLVVAGGVLVGTAPGGPGGASGSAVLVDRSPSPQRGPAPVDRVARLRGGKQPGATAPPDVVVLPVLGVRASVSAIRAHDGALVPPSDPREVGWWADGRRPGSPHGAAVLTGHTVHTGGGAFDDLEELAPGDRVVVLAGRARIGYDVETVRVLSRAELARENRRVLGGSGPARLVLVTCEDWDGSAYRSNVVVTAAPAGVSRRRRG